MGGGEREREGRERGGGGLGRVQLASHCCKQTFGLWFERATKSYLPKVHPRQKEDTRRRERQRIDVEREPRDRPTAVTCPLI